MQVRPHMPQWALLVAVLTHTPLQSVCPAGQAQRPIAQVVPPVQVTPQAPQLPLSVAVSMHTPLQAV